MGAVSQLRIEKDVKPLAIHDAVWLACKLSPAYAVVYAGRLSRRSWKALAKATAQSTHLTRKRFKEAHVDLVKYQSWKPDAAASRLPRCER